MRTLILILITSCVLQMNAQSFRKTAGLKFDFYPSIVYKTYQNEINANEWFVTLGYKGFQCTGLHEKYIPELFPVENLNFYYGYGAHMGLISNLSAYYDDVPFIKPIRRLNTYTVMGLDFIAGLEYQYRDYPFILGIDYNPYFDINGPNYFNMHTGCFALSIKYILNN